MSNIIPLIPEILTKALEGQPSVSPAKQTKALLLFEEAYEAKSQLEARRLLEMALKQDPTNINIIHLFISVLELPEESELLLLRKLLALAEKQLGKKLFQEAKGHFWMLYETRPYMMIREEIAHKLLLQGELEEACDEWQALLELNPSDNQGIRYDLLSGLMILGNLTEAKKIIQQFDECKYSTVFAWYNVLLLLLTGDELQATKALAVARKQNPHTESFILGKGRLPSEHVDSYTIGDISESQMYGTLLQVAWSKYPQALNWLVAQGKTPQAKRTTKAAKK